MKRETFPDGHGQGGVALLEVLVSILLFSLGILGLIGLQARAISLSVDAEDRNRAALLANEVASEMWMRQSVVLPAAMLEAWQDRVGDPQAGGLPNGEGDVTVVGRAADVTITWRPPARAAGEDDSRLTTRVVMP